MRPLKPHEPDDSGWVLVAAMIVAVLVIQVALTLQHRWGIS